MANPYHDDLGQFCSRNRMLARIDELAIAGKIDEYIQLRKDLDEADKGSVLVDEKFLNKLVYAAEVDESEVNRNVQNDSVIYDPEDKFSYKGLTPSKLVEELTNLSFESQKGVDNSEKILAAVKASDYHDEVIYRAISSGLSPEQQFDLIANHKPEYFSFLLEDDPETFLKQHKEAVQAEVVRENALPLNEKSTWNINQMTSNLATYAETSEDLDFAIENINYDSDDDTTSSRVTNNPIATKAQMRTVLTGLSQAASTQNYWNARYEMVDNLRRRGLPYPGEPKDYPNETKKGLTHPGPNSYSASLLIKEASDEQKLAVILPEELRRAYTKLDAFAPTLDALRGIYASATYIRRKGGSSYSRKDIAHVERRINEAETYIQQVEDLKAIQSYLQ